MTFVIGCMMKPNYDPATCDKLAKSFQAAKVLRPMRVERYEPGATLTYDVAGVAPAARARVTVRIEKFVGGGFAGQVYRVTVLEIQALDGEACGLKVGGAYAMKILVPPSSSARRFRDALYMVGFQGPFQLQVNPAAARSGALWQKLIRRAAAIRFGSERSVVDILATFVDPTLGSCGELSEWVDGRVWRFEVDDNLTALRKWCRGKPVDETRLGSPEFRAKRRFMGEFVRLLHDAGAPELARQYEWWTCKSQPNCLKRWDSEGDPAAGLTAVDFRAGLALLAFLPMSPGDVSLILQGLARKSLVQFDRGDLGKLESFVGRHAEEFADLRGALEELKRIEPQYREAIPDVTHHHVRLLGSRRLWGSILDSTVAGWQVRRVVDEQCAAALKRRRLLILCFLLVGFLPWLSVAGGVAAAAALWAARGFSWGWIGLGAVMAASGAVAGRLVRRVWGRSDLRQHYRSVFSSWDYFERSVRAKMAETLIGWLRAGRVSDARALHLNARPGRFLFHAPVSVFPAAVHRFLTDAAFAREKLAGIFLRPIILYFNAEARERWLREMLAEGQKNNMLTDEDADTIRGQLKDPFIQKYLKSLAVHVCTLPVTQLVALVVAICGIVAHDMTWAQASAFTVTVFVVFQAIPISPGSLVRGLYVVYVVVRDRNIRDYNIAVCLGFFKYIGYSAFPIQMAYRYPTLARFMAGRWATGAVEAVPVFGERGALLEHAMFGLFYNYPLTVRRRMSERAARRRTLPPRAWHAPVVVAAAGGVLAAIEYAAAALAGVPPTLKAIWPLVFVLPLLAGAAVTAGAGGCAVSRRIILAAVSGAASGAVYAAVRLLAVEGGADGAESAASWAGRFLATAVWPAFTFVILTTLGALATEVLLPEQETAPIMAESSGGPERVPAQPT